MPGTVSSELKKYIIVALVVTAAISSYCFKMKNLEQDWLAWANRCLAQSYDGSRDNNLKKVEIMVTADDFIRLRKVFLKGKEEYYSFNLKKFNDLDYSGTSTNGTLELKTTADDIIVQTRNDREGDVDSMTTTLNIPVKNMEPERLDSLRDAFNYFKIKGQR